jgi:hypothetical protein
MPEPLLNPLATNHGVPGINARSSGLSASQMKIVP